MDNIICPYCNEEIPKDSKVCEYCCEEINDNNIDSNTSIDEKESKFCVNCGEKVDISVEKCEYCGGVFVLENEEKTSKCLTFSEYKINIIDVFEKKSFSGLYLAIDLITFFILLFLIGWIGAFIISGAVGFILNSLDPLSKEIIKTSNYSLLFEKDQILFKSEEKEKSNIYVPFDSISDVEDVKLLPENYNSQILIKRHNDSAITFALSKYSQETFKELLEKIAEQINHDTINDHSNYNEFIDKIKKNYSNYQVVFLSATFPNVTIFCDLITFP